MRVALAALALVAWVCPSDALACPDPEPALRSVRDDAEDLHLADAQRDIQMVVDALGCMDAPITARLHRDLFLAQAVIWFNGGRPDEQVQRALGAARLRDDSFDPESYGDDLHGLWASVQHKPAIHVPLTLENLTRSDAVWLDGETVAPPLWVPPGLHVLQVGEVSGGMWHAAIIDARLPSTITLPNRDGTAPLQMAHEAPQFDSEPLQEGILYLSPVLVMEGSSDEMDAVAGQLESAIAARLAKHFDVRDIDEVPPYADYDARTYMRGCPDGQYSGCALITGSRIGARWTVGGTLRTTEDGVLAEMVVIDNALTSVLELQSVTSSEAIDDLAIRLDGAVQVVSTGALDGQDLRVMDDSLAARREEERRRREEEAEAIDFMQEAAGPLTRGFAVEIPVPSYAAEPRKAPEYKPRFNRPPRPEHSRLLYPNPRTTQVTLGSGYGGYGASHFVATSAELAFTLAKRPALALAMGLDAWVSARPNPDPIPGQRTRDVSVGMFPFHLGLQYRIRTWTAVIPYLGADTIAVVWPSNGDYPYALGGRARLGADFMATRSIGLNVDCAMGLWTSRDWPTTLLDAPRTGWVPRLRVGFVFAN